MQESLFIHKIVGAKAFNFLKKRCFPVNFDKCLKTPIFRTLPKLNFKQTQSL